MIKPGVAAGVALLGWNLAQLPPKPADFRGEVEKLGVRIKEEYLNPNSGTTTLFLPEDHSRNPVDSETFKSLGPVYMEGVLANPSDRDRLKKWQASVLNGGGIKIDTDYDLANSPLRDTTPDDSKVGVRGLETYNSQKWNLTFLYYGYCLNEYEILIAEMKKQGLKVINLGNKSDGIPRFIAVMGALEQDNDKLPKLISKKLSDFDFKVSQSEESEVKSARNKFNNWTEEYQLGKRNKEWLGTIGTDVNCVVVAGEFHFRGANSLQNLFKSKNRSYLVGTR